MTRLNEGKMVPKCLWTLVSLTKTTKHYVNLPFLCPNWQEPKAILCFYPIMSTS